MGRVVAQGGGPVVGDGVALGSARRAAERLLHGDGTEIEKKHTLTETVRVAVPVAELVRW